jgi:hypothetical protein
MSSPKRTGENESEKYSRVSLHVLVTRKEGQSSTANESRLTFPCHPGLRLDSGFSGFTAPLQLGNGTALRSIGRAF